MRSEEKWEWDFKYPINLFTLGLSQLQIAPSCCQAWVSFHPNKGDLAGLSWGFVSRSVSRRRDGELLEALPERHGALWLPVPGPRWGHPQLFHCLACVFNLCLQRGLVKCLSVGAWGWLWLNPTRAIQHLLGAGIWPWHQGYPQWQLQGCAAFGSVLLCPLPWPWAHCIGLVWGEAEGSEGVRTGNTGVSTGLAALRPSCVVRAEGRPPGKGTAAAAISQLAQKTERPFWFCLSFLGLWMESSLPTAQRASRSCLEGWAHSIQHVASSGSVHAITLKFPLAVCLLCVLHNQLLAKSSQTLFPWIFPEGGSLGQQK